MMYNYISFVISTLILVSLTTFILGFHYKNRIEKMHSMTLSMIFGMNAGLTIGLLLGLIFHGNLFHATLFAMAAGIISGLLPGIAFGTLSFLEGIFSGMMSGMMGAMLGEMITLQQGLVFVNIFLTMSVSSLLLFPVISGQINKGKIRKLRWLFKPLFVSLFLSAYLLIGTSFSQKSTCLQNQQEHENHKGQGLHTDALF